ncbi:MAG: hypothetical protein JXR71_11685 [Bacteroidales bacterium]|nr:hypothetical protein [Bacteroidales bacterium]
MQDIKKIIDENRASWDNRDLPEGHEERFLNRLETMNRPGIRQKLNVVFRVAAAVFLLVSVVWLTVEPFKSIKASNTVHTISLSPEMQQVVSYYNIQSSSDSAAIQKLSTANRMTEYIDATAQRQLEKLESQLFFIEKEYAKNPGNKSVQAALVNVQRKKAEILNSLKEKAQLAATTVQMEK